MENPESVILVDETFSTNSMDEMLPLPMDEILPLPPDFKEPLSDPIEPLVDPIEPLADPPIDPSNIDVTNELIDENEPSPAVPNEPPPIEQESDQQNSQTNSLYVEGGKKYFPTDNSEHQATLAEILNENDNAMNRIKGQIIALEAEKRAIKDEMKKKSFFAKILSTVIKPIRGIVRLIQKITGNEDKIKYSPEEMALRKINEKRQELIAQYASIEKQNEDFKTLNNIEITAGNDPPTFTRTAEPEPQRPLSPEDVEEAKDGFSEDNLPIIPENQEKKPSPFPVEFAKTLNAIYTNKDFGEIKIKKEEKGFVLDVNYENKHYQFLFDKNKGILTPIPNDSTPEIPQEKLNSLQKRTYIAYAATSMAFGKFSISDNYIKKSINPEIEKMLSGKQKVAKVKIGNVRFTISPSKDGEYNINIGPQNGKDSMVIKVSGDRLKPEKLNATVYLAIENYARTMCMSYLTPSFMEYANSSPLLNQDEKASKINEINVNKGDIEFEVSLNGNDTSKTIPVVLLTDSFAISPNTTEPLDISEQENKEISRLCGNMHKTFMHFIVNETGIMPEVLLSSTNIQEILNAKIDEIQQGEKTTIDLYGAKIQVDKTQEPTRATIETRTGAKQHEVILYDGHFDLQDISQVVKSISQYAQQQALQYEKNIEALNHQMETEFIPTSDDFQGDVPANSAEAIDHERDLACHGDDGCI